MQKRLLPVAIAALCLYVVISRLGDVDVGRISALLAAVTPFQWAAALLASEAAACGPR